MTHHEGTSSGKIIFGSLITGAALGAFGGYQAAKNIYATDHTKAEVSKTFWRAVSTVSIVAALSLAVVVSIKK